MTIADLDSSEVVATASKLTKEPQTGDRNLRAKECTPWDTKGRNLDFEAEAKSYLHERFGIVFANWIDAVFLGRFKCIDPEAHRGQEIMLWGCIIDASKLRDSTQKQEVEKLTVQYTQAFMGNKFADFLNVIFRGHIQQGFVDSSTGMMAMLTKPLYLLEKIDEETVACFAMLAFIEEDPNRPGVFLSKGTTNAQRQSWDATCSHKPCAVCGQVLTTTKCFKCKLSLCRKCTKPCILCRMPVCPFCHPIHRHDCLPQKLPPPVTENLSV